jgi:signal transduction histidine kinase
VTAAATRAANSILTWPRRAIANIKSSVGFLAAELAASVVSLAMLVALIVTICLIPVVVGWLALPEALKLLRRFTNNERSRVARRLGQVVHLEPVPSGTGVMRSELLPVGRTLAWRELAWLGVHGTVGLMSGLLAAALPLGALTALLVPTYWWVLPSDEPTTPIYPVTSWAGALGMIPIAAAYALAALILLPLFAKWYVTWARKLLISAQGGVTLEARVDELTASRASALEAHGVELRRIERDLHDGAQNRLVGVLMHLGIAERALERDPENAHSFLASAQQAAQEALTDLRGTVRNIYPPVLSEHGLKGALAWIATRSGTPVRVETEGLQRAPAAVEAAAYFTVAEALTNVVKHSGATEVHVMATSKDGNLVVEVTDNGVGGADELLGTGLAGIRSRVQAFDGNLVVDSPIAGPTTLRVEIPCGS